MEVRPGSGDQTKGWEGKGTRIKDDCYFNLGIGIAMAMAMAMGMGMGLKNGELRNGRLIEPFLYLSVYLTTEQECASLGAAGSRETVITRE